MGISLKRKATKSKSKWTRREFIIWGFNFIVGYAFVIGLNKSFAPVGHLLPLIICLGGLIAFTSGYSFGRLSKRFASNGGAYLYVKHLFGKKTSYFTGIFQYVQAPFVGLSAFFGMIWAFQNIMTAGGGALNLSTTWYIGFMAICLFIIAYVVMLFGFSATKISLYILWILKWSILFLTIVIAFVEVFKVGPGNLNPVKAGNVGVDNLVQSVITFFFAFGGFEGIAVVSEDLENPKKNMAISLIVIISLAALFYMFYYYLIIGALGTSNTSGGEGHIGPLNPNDKTYDVNPINLLIQKAGISLTFGVTALSNFVLLAVLLSQLANKSTSRLMNGWVNARIIAAIASDGFLPKYFTAKNKYNQLRNSLNLDAMITFGLIIIFYPIYLSTSFSIADTIDLYTISAFIQYLFVVSAAIKLWLYEKKSNIKSFEIISYVALFFILLFILFAYFIFGFDAAISSIKSHKVTAKNIGIIITTSTFILIFIGAIVLYITGKSLGWHKDMDINNGDFSSHHDLADIEGLTNL